MRGKRLAAALCGACLLAVSLFGVACAPAETMPVEEGATVVKIMAREFEQWRNDHFTSLVRSINEDLNDGIQVELEFVIEENFNDRLETARETGTAPDVIMYSYNHIYTQMSNGNIAALDGYVSEAALGDIKDEVKEAIEFGGKTYAYPWYTEASTVLFYSKSKFAQAGIVEPPKTWQELLDACEKLKSTMPRGTYALGMPLGGDIGWATWGMIYNQLGGWPITEDWSRSVFDDADKVRDYARFLDFYGKLYDNAYTPVSALHANGYNEIISAWADGKYAMTLAVSSQLGTLIQEYPDTLDDVGIAVMPTESGNAEAVTATNGGWCLGIDAKSSHKDLAGQVIERLLYTNTEKNVEFYTMSGYSRISALKSVDEAASALAESSEYKDFAAVIGDVCSHAVMEPIYSWNISLQMAWSMENMIQGATQTTVQITQELKDKVENIIAVYELAGKNPHGGEA